VFIFCPGRVTASARQEMSSLTSFSNSTYPKCWLSKGVHGNEASGSSSFWCSASLHACNALAPNQVPIGDPSFLISACPGPIRTLIKPNVTPSR